MSTIITAGPTASGNPDSEILIQDVNNVPLVKIDNDGTGALTITVVSPYVEGGLIVKNPTGGAGQSIVCAATSSSNCTFRLPASNGSSGQTLHTDGAGNTFWA